MKVKLLVAGALTGLFAATLAFAAPTDEIPTMTTADTDASQPSAGGAPDTGAPPTQNTDMSNPGASAAAPPASSDSNTNSMTPTTTGSDDMSADTATGDDDY